MLATCYKLTLVVAILLIISEISIAFSQVGISQRIDSRSITALRMSSSTTDSQQGKLLLSNLTTLSTDGPVRLILASQSPRRREILDMMGLTGRYLVQPSPLDEEKLQKELANQSFAPKDYAKKLAESKAHALAEEMSNSSVEYEQEYTLLLGSDTIVDLEGEILEKPKTEDDAKTMLSKLSGSWHEVHTGVALYKMTHSEGGVVELVSSFTDTARVKFTSLSVEDINAYVGTGEPMDKAGSYGIQGIGGQMVERMEGDFFTVMGLPMHRLSGEMAKALCL